MTKKKGSRRPHKKTTSEERVPVIVEMAHGDIENIKKKPLLIEELAQKDLKT